MKLLNIIKESKYREGESVKVNRFDMKALFYMCQEKVNPMNIDEVYNFLVDNLYLKNEEEIVKIIKLYKHNFSYEDIQEKGGCEMSEDSIDNLIREDYDEEKIVLGEWLGVNPYLLVMVSQPSENYLAEYREFKDENDYRVGTYRDVVSAAKKSVLDTIETEGYDYFDSDWLSYYIEIDEESAKYDAEERAKEDVVNYDDETLRDMIYVTNEYEGLIDDRKYEEYELKEKIGEYKIVKFKLEKLNKEKKIIEREIETLGFSLDYDNDDDGGYSEMYNVDISEMTDTLHKLETVIFEHLSYVEQLETEIHEVEETIKESNKLVYQYEGEDLKEMAVEVLSEDYLQKYSDDPITYVEDSGFTIGEAESEGMISINEDEVVREHVSNDRGFILADYDGLENTTIFNGIKYYIYRT